MREADWLWAIPQCSPDQQGMVLKVWLSLDPEAAAISEVEAERFFGAAHLLLYLDNASLEEVFRRLGIRFQHRSEANYRRGITSLLRQWRHQRIQDELLFFVCNVDFPGYRSAASGRDFWTPERFRQALAEEHQILWLALIAREIGSMTDPADWLKQVMGTRSEAYLKLYQNWANVVRITMRRLFSYDAQAARAQSDAAPSAEMVSALREQDRESSALRRDVRRLEQDRKQLREQNRRAALEAQALLSQARGEVAAARRALQDRQAEMRRELADLEKRCQVQKDGLQAQIAAARAAFLREFSGRARSETNFLHGRTVTVIGDADTDVHRMLVESLGGRLAAEGGEITLQGGNGCTDLERQLRAAALDQVLIKCDGLFRVKGSRPGIAVGAFEVYAGGWAVYQSGSVVCCGRAAHSQMAEYGALLSALTWVVKAGPAPGARVEIWSDCKHMISRLRQGNDRPPAAGCVTLHRLVRQKLRVLARRGCEVTVRWVPREQVDAADRLCDAYYRQASWYHRPRRMGTPRFPLKAFLVQYQQLRPE
ncbi:MAG TPA: reverse transcriptase-like protein [Symbiobacteriaceae bacterium]|nr:reverse transcriptase-like protein [Symbiobacteriaceae bacterium]